MTSLIVLVVIIAVFALRGYFLGFSGILIRGLSVSAGLYVALTQHTWLAREITARIPPEGNVPPLAIQSLSSFIVFIGTLLAIRIAGSLVFRLLGAVAGESLSKKTASSNRLFGIILNSGIGALFATLLIWVGVMVVGAYAPKLVLQDEFGLTIAQSMNEMAIGVALPTLEKMGMTVPENADKILDIKNISHNDEEDEQKGPNIARGLAVLQAMKDAHAATKQAADTQPKPEAKVVPKSDASHYQLLEGALAGGKSLKEFLSSKKDSGEVSDTPTSSGNALDYVALAQRVARAQELWQQNPAIAEVLQDPEIVTLMNEGNIADLLDSPKFQSLSQSIDQSSMDGLTDLLLLMNQQNSFGGIKKEASP